MQQLLQRMQHEHRRFEALLDYLDGRVDGFAAGDGPDWDDLDRLLDFLRPGLAGEHYQAEGRLWERLALHPQGPQLFIAALRNLQRAVAAHACDLEDAVSSARLGRVVPGDRLQALAREFSAALRRQIALEERALFPFAERLLTRSDRPPLHAMPERATVHRE
jgi:hemerythrin-like domain-containing protein